MRVTPFPVFFSCQGLFFLPGPFSDQPFLVPGLAAAAGARALLGAGVTPGECEGQESVGEPGQRHQREGCLPHPQVPSEGLCSEVRV